MNNNSRLLARKHLVYPYAGIACLLSLGGCSDDTTDADISGQGGSTAVVQNGGSSATGGRTPGGLTSTGGRTQADSRTTTQATTGGASQVSTGGATQASTGGATQPNTGGTSHVATGGTSQTSTGGATQASTGGATQVNVGGTSQISAGGTLQFGTAGATQANIGGTSQISAGGTSQANVGGTSQTSSGGVTQAGSGGASQLTTGGASQVNTGGSSQATNGGSSQGGTGGTLAGGGTSPIGTGGTTQAGSSIPDAGESVCFDESGAAVPYDFSFGIIAEYTFELSTSCDVGGYLMPLAMADPEQLTQVNAFIADATDWYRADILKCNGAITQLDDNTYGLLPPSQSSDLSQADVDASLALLIMVLGRHDGLPDGVSADKKAIIENRIKLVGARAVHNSAAGLTKTLTEPDCVPVLPATSGG